MEVCDARGKKGNGKDDRVQNADFRIQKGLLNSETCILHSVILAAK
jgi:hypothetical protein